MGEATRCLITELRRLAPYRCGPTAKSVGHGAQRGGDRIAYSLRRESGRNYDTGYTPFSHFQRPYVSLH